MALVVRACLQCIWSLINTFHQWWYQCTCPSSSSLSCQSYPHPCRSPASHSVSVWGDSPSPRSHSLRQYYTKTRANIILINLKYLIILLENSWGPPCLAPLFNTDQLLTSGHNTRGSEGLHWSLAAVTHIVLLSTSSRHRWWGAATWADVWDQYHLVNISYNQCNHDIYYKY